MSRSLTEAEAKAQLASVQWEDAWPDPRDEEIARLREALRHISLCSQNSMSSKEECGRIARTALNGEKE